MSRSRKGIFASTKEEIMNFSATFAHLKFEIFITTTKHLEIDTHPFPFARCECRVQYMCGYIRFSSAELCFIALDGAFSRTIEY